MCVAIVSLVVAACARQVVAKHGAIFLWCSKAWCLDFQNKILDRTFIVVHSNDNTFCRSLVKDIVLRFLELLYGENT
jgi:hypothetical protein